jgi:DNA-binding PadR family transcriptional regulator
MIKEDIRLTLKEKEKLCDYSLHRVSRFIQPSLLLFLARRPTHGYQLIDDMKSLGFHDSEVDIGAVYRNLRKLEAEGFVVSSWEKGESRRKRRNYRITLSGRDLLDQWAGRIRERMKSLEEFIRIYEGDRK